MKRNKYIIFVLMLLFFSACSNKNNSSASVQEHKEDKQRKEFNYTSYLDGVNLSENQEIGVSADFKIDIADIGELRDGTTNVFIGTIDSIDGCSTIAETGEFIPIPQTYGKITVIDNLSGKVTNPTIKFTRAGGTLTIAEYEEYAPEEMIINDDKHRKEVGLEDIDKESTYLTFFYDDDITIEAGKTYLFFTIYESKTDSYVIDGVQYGAREIYQPSSKKSVFRTMPEESSLTVKNNDTEEYESLENLIDQYFSE